MAIFGIDEKSHLIISPFLATKVDKYTKPVDIKKFYMDLYTAFSENKMMGFKDMLGEKGDKAKGAFFEGAVKLGEQMDNKSNLNRTAYLYEKKFTWNKFENFIELELIWEARVPAFYSSHGWIEIKVDLVNRTMKDKEFLVGNDKIVMQTGTWEFRNSMTYKNKVIPAYVSKIPWLGSSHKFQHFYVEHFYEHVIENDIIEFGIKKIKPILNGVIEKHFMN